MAAWHRILALVALAGGTASLALAATPQAQEIRLVSISSGQPEPILTDGLKTTQDALAADYRGCFTTPLSLGMLTETFTVDPLAKPEPDTRGLSCYDPARLTEDLRTGEAVAFLSEPDITPGMDRVVAIYSDGRAYAWHQRHAAEN
ncbi:DUF6446 family protein [Thioclava sp. GXIMD4216]|uniref:DUF6446 family protein n=1 Tax=Thioclava litoralis TaxID=3076557 RepID=A0ABZ1E1N3_9RHOB|nr:DUF6446 family protein [Thioclava sp. FTW29]